MSERLSSRRAFLLGLVGLILVIAALVLNRPSKDEPALPTTAEAPALPPDPQPEVSPPPAEAAVAPDPSASEPTLPEAPAPAPPPASAEKPADPAPEAPAAPQASAEASVVPQPSAEAPVVREPASAAVPPQAAEAPAASPAEPAPPSSVPPSSVPPSSAPSSPVASVPAEDPPLPPLPPPPVAAPATDDAAKPSFDVVRVNPQGDAVIAGRAQPEANVTVFDGDKPIGTVTADKRGEWVLLPDRALPGGDRELSLSATGPAGRTVESEQVVVLSIPAPKAPPSAAPAPEAAAPADHPLAVVVNRDGSPGSTLLQAPAEAGAAGRLTVDSIDYGKDGGLLLAGRGEAGHGVRAYVDNEPIGDAEVGGNGLWQLRPEAEIRTGPSTLRIDLLAPQGKVTQRLELPFSRAAPEQVQLAAEGNRVVVQPGNSLWRIARRVYGGGVHYTVIYRANAEQIRDPDLIYPGQVFSLPPSR